MENRSFEGESPSGSPPKNPNDNPAGPSEPRAGPSGESKDQASESVPPLARISGDEDGESPPAYIKRHMPQKKKIPDDLEDLEAPPPTDPVQELHDDRFSPLLKRQASDRSERRKRQLSTEGTCSLRSDSPNLPPLPAPVPYSHLDNGQQQANAPNPEQQQANAPNPEQQSANAPNPGLQEANESDPLQQSDNATVRFAMWRERCYETMNTFCFQFPFHILLLTWPLATGILGALNFKFCSINNDLPWMMMFIGSFGTVTILLRLWGIWHENEDPSERRRDFWIVTRSLEFIAWIFFCAELYLFFKQAPSYNPGDEHYCKPKFYKINCGLMFLTSATMIGWMVINIGKFIYWFPRRNEHSNA